MHKKQGRKLQPVLLGQIRDYAMEKVFGIFSGAKGL